MWDVIFRLFCQFFTKPEKKKKKIGTTFVFIAGIANRFRVRIAIIYFTIYIIQIVCRG